jgi:ELWxxDGT repeat protein
MSYNAQLQRTNGQISGSSAQGVTSVAATKITGPGATLGSTIYFMARNQTSGFELWKCGGTAATTSFVKYLATTSTTAPILFATSTSLWFTIENPTSTTSPGNQLWQSDGTAAGTLQVTKPMNVSKFIAQVSDRIYFIANGQLQIMPAALNAKASTGWAMAYGLTGSNTTPSADPDKDGKTNLRELLEGTAPNIGLPNANCPLLTGTALSTAKANISALASRHGVSVWLETSNNLLNWTRTPTTPLVVPTTAKDEDCLSYPFTSTHFYRFSALEP